MQIGLSIVKRVLFRGVQQEFANVYHYVLPTAAVAPSEALIDEAVVTEKALHSTDVTFVRASTWSSGGTPGANQMLFEKALTGTGTYAPNTNLDRERAVLMQWRAGLDIRGKPVYLRKWYHPCGGIAAQLFSAAEMQQTTEIDPAKRAAIETKVGELSRLGTAEIWELCSKSGRLREGNAPPVCHRYLEHHQLGDAWR